MEGLSSWVLKITVFRFARIKNIFFFLRRIGSPEFMNI